MNTSTDERAIPLQSEASWNLWRKGNAEQPSLQGIQLENADLSDFDLSGVDFTGANLSGSLFTGCDLRGVNLNGARLVNADFTHARIHGGQFVGTRMDSAAFIGAEIFDCTFRDVDATGARFTLAKIENCQIEKAAFAGARFNDTQISGTAVRQSNLDGSKFHKARWKKSGLEDCTFRHVDASELRLTDCTIDNLATDGTEIQSLSAMRCFFRRVDWPAGTPTTGEYADFIDCRFVNCDFTQSPLSKTSFSRSSTTSCRWPVITMEMTRSGLLLSNSQLMSSPVEEVSGIPELEKRSIRRAQVLRAIEASASARGRAAKTGFRVWGICSGYGESLTRWTLTALICIALFVPLWLLTGQKENCLSGDIMLPGQRVASHIRLCDDPHHMTLPEAAAQSAAVFVTLGLAGPSDPGSVPAEALLVFEAATGLVMAGTLVSIFTRALSRL